VEERVLVIPDERLRELLGDEEGFLQVDETLIRGIIEEHGMFMPRDEAEYDPSFRQVIPYMVILKGDELLLLQRTEKQGEKRLHNKYSVGIGGHVNSLDGVTPLDAYFNGKERELHEELHVEVVKERYLGIINDRSSEVSSVHVGLVYVVMVRSADIREKENFLYWWIKRNELTKHLQKMENWSRLVVEYMISNGVRIWDTDAS